MPVVNILNTHTDDTLLIEDTELSDELAGLVRLIEEITTRTMELERELMVAERQRDDAILAQTAVETQRETAVMLGLQVADQRDALAVERDGLAQMVTQLQQAIAELQRENSRLRAPAAASVCVNTPLSPRDRASMLLGNFRSAMH